MTELLITVLFLFLFTSMVITANLMLSQVAGETISVVQQTSLSSVIINALTYEMRTSSDVVAFSGGYLDEYSGITHADNAGFVYNSKLFDFKQTNTYDASTGVSSNYNYREIIFVDSNNYKLYVGRADYFYSIDPTGPSTVNEESKALIGGAMYGDVKVYLYNPSNTSQKTKVNADGTFEIVLFLENDVLGTSSLNIQQVSPLII